MMNLFFFFFDLGLVLSGLDFVMIFVNFCFV